mmetsp:Transcript_82588/g.233695  ORF Transcript_82588/g.233695 Transcript_82588/m.233695 type:complete len:331 (-) Transcript_82588:123-1115(-)
MLLVPSRSNEPIGGGDLGNECLRWGPVVNDIRVHHVPALVAHAIHARVYGGCPRERSREDIQHSGYHHGARHLFLVRVIYHQHHDPHQEHQRLQDEARSGRPRLLHRAPNPSQAGQPRVALHKAPPAHGEEADEAAGRAGFQRPAPERQGRDQKGDVHAHPKGAPSVLGVQPHRPACAARDAEDWHLGRAPGAQRAVHPEHGRCGVGSRCGRRRAGQGDSVRCEGCARLPAVQRRPGNSERGRGAVVLRGRAVDCRGCPGGFAARGRRGCRGCDRALQALPERSKVQPDLHALPRALCQALHREAQRGPDGSRLQVCALQLPGRNPGAGR